ncbi:YicC/YloC family endoribonuclease [Tropicimonas sp. IMCC34043]|uniref:YicC/YloC family endoribonuclease n=1 Tax=Tropicimonas sp. IMCC34043 TaxID=2248760 RepID=UPI000E270810|nr:YicC/YloC family endoribonuclease [Tropicimonas sp. IMCC34043]
MVKSMTAYAGHSDQGADFSWIWDLRSLNGKGQDLRLRVPDWIEGLEAGLRARLAGVVRRGSVTLTLRLARLDDTAEEALDPAGLDRALALLARVADRADRRGLALTPPTAVDVLAMKGVLAPAGEVAATDSLREKLLADLDRLLVDFAAMRAAEGAALATVLADQLDQIEALTRAASAAAMARTEQARESLRAALARVLDAAEGLDETRLTQELALIAVKADITEELDRLAAHVDAARALLAEPGPIGRKLEFLTQEFNREANTLCSKSQDVALTRIGLDLKAVIDQMREQVQNVE